MIEERVEPPFDVFELVRALSGAREWVRYLWGDESVNTALGDHLFQSAIEDFAHARMSSPVVRSVISPKDFERQFGKTSTPSGAVLNDGSGRAAAAANVSEKTFASASRDSGKRKFPRFEYFFEMDGWFRFSFNVVHATVLGVKRVGLYLSIAYEPCDAASVPERFQTLRPPSARNTPREELRRIPLPRYPSPEFLGRDNYLRQIRKVIRGGAPVPTVLLDGPPGVGKTDVALAAALSLTYRYPELLYLNFSSYADARDPNELISDLLASAVRTLEAAFAQQGLAASVPAAELRRRYLSLLNGRGVIVICDDVESAAYLSQFEPPEGCALIAVSTAAIAGDAATNRMGIGPLTLSDAATLLRRHSNGRLTGPVPEEVILQISVQERFTFDGNADMSFIVAQLFDCMPLALVNVATFARLRPDVPASALLQRFLDTTRRLSLNPEHERTMPPPIEAAYELRFDTMSPEQQRLFARLSVFPSSFNGDAARAVCGAEAETELSELVRLNLVEFRKKGGRYVLLKLARAFAHRQLLPEEKESALGKFGEYFSEFAERLTETLKTVTRENLGEPLAAFDSEDENLFSCLHLISHRMCNAEWWASLGIKFVGLLEHPRMVASIHYEPAARTIAHCAQEVGDDAVLAAVEFHIGRILAARPGWYSLAEYSHDAEDVLLDCAKRARELRNPDLERSALGQAIRSSIRRNTHEKTFEYLAEKIPLDAEAGASLELLYDALVTFETTLLGKTLPIGVPRVEIDHLEAASYGALVLYETIQEIPTLYADMSHRLLAARNSANAPELTLENFLYSLVVHDSEMSERWFSYVELHLLVTQLGYVTGLHSILDGPLPLPTLGLLYPDALRPDQTIAWMTSGIRVADAIQRVDTGAQLRLLRAGLLRDSGDVAAACNDLEDAIVVSSGTVFADLIRKSAEVLLTSLGCRSAESRRSSDTEPEAAPKERHAKKTSSKQR